MSNTFYADDGVYYSLYADGGLYIPAGQDYADAEIIWGQPMRHNTRDEILQALFLFQMEHRSAKYIHENLSSLQQQMPIYTHELEALAEGVPFNDVFV